MEKQSILMCRNTPVYNIDTEVVLCEKLLPGLLKAYPCSATFKRWMQCRYSSSTNTLACKLKGNVFGQSKRITIDRETRALSLTDCYWVKQSDEQDVNFFSITPYNENNKIFSGVGSYENGTAIPTLYVSGYLSKQWITSEILEKYGKETEIEYECYMLCKSLGISCNEIEKIENGIRVKNITNTIFMLEQADQSGYIDPDDFDEYDIISLFGLSGVQMLIVDAIIGNGDRHAGNFGWLRNTITGKYVCMAPLYDFDHALDSTLDSDRLLEDACTAVLNRGYNKELVRICSSVLELETLEVFKKRAKTMLSISNNLFL